MSLDRLLILIIKENQQRRRLPLGKTKLLKIAYIIDLFHKRNTSKKLLNLDWIYYLYGPWLREYDETINKYPFKTERIKLEGEKEQIKIELDEDYNYIKDTNFDIDTALNSAFSRFIDKPLDDILEYVYFDTEPMLNAKERMEILSFDIVQKSEYFRVKELHLTQSIKRNIENKLKERVKQLHG